MRRVTVLATLAIPLTLLAGCAGLRATQAGPAQPPPAVTTPPAADATSSPPSTAAPPSTPAAPPTPAAPVCRPDDGPGGILSSLTVSHLTDRDRVVFQFHGHGTPSVRTGYADRITEDPSDRPVPLLGTAFLSVVFHGGRLDSAPIESDPGQATRYDGPTRITPRYPVLRELAVAGDFEAVLSFGLGLSGRARVRTSTPAGQGCVILDLSR